MTEDKLICDVCGEPIEVGEFYAHIDIGDKYVHEECEDEFWEDLKRGTVFYHTRGAEDQEELD